MVKRFFLCVVSLAALLSAAAADYFPLGAGNGWIFSYVSTSAPVVLNPSVTKDSGTVKWEICYNHPLDSAAVICVKQTRSLMRRTMTTSDSDGGYDSVFTPSRTMVDTIFLDENLTAPGKANDISFANSDCPFAEHDPTVTMPADLSWNDTTVSFLDSAVAGKKMIVSACSCLDDRYSYSFTLGPDIGPVEAYISWCPGMAGSSYEETWKLISREYPTAVLKGNAPPPVLERVAAKQTSGRITCSMNLAVSSPVRIEVLDFKGRSIATLFKGNLDAGAYRYSWNIPIKAVGIALLRVWTGTEDQCVRIIMGVK